MIRGAAQELAQGDKDGGVGHQVVAQLSGAAGKGRMPVPGDDQLGEIGAGVGRAVLAQLPGADRGEGCGAARRRAAVAGACPSQHVGDGGRSATRVSSASR